MSTSLHSLQHINSDIVSYISPGEYLPNSIKKSKCLIMVTTDNVNVMEKLENTFLLLPYRAKIINSDSGMKKVVNKLDLVVLSSLFPKYVSM